MISVACAERFGSTDSADDASLVGRIRRGDRAALGLLYDRHGPRLLATAVRMLGAEREAQDLLHDVFLEAWQHARDYDEARGSVRAWLAMRLRSRALDRIGRAESVRTRSLSEAVVEVETLAFSSCTTDWVDRFALRQALDRVASDVRQILELTYFDGLTAKEIAGLLVVPVGTVKSRLARGLDVLSSVLHPRAGI